MKSLRRCSRPQYVFFGPLVLVLALVVITGSLVPEAHAIRICSYNVLNYDNQDAVRDTSFQAIIDGIGNIDILAIQEVQNLAAMNDFENQILDVIEPGAWARAFFFDDPDVSFNQGLFYRIATVTIVDSDTLGNCESFFFTECGGTENCPRDISYVTFRPVGYSSSEAECTIFNHHFKASTGSCNEAIRLQEARRLRAFMNTFPAGTNMIVLGDFNMRASTETAYQTMTASQAINIGRVFDPISNSGTWYNQFSKRFVHTQSTRTGTLSPSDGGATGGMDDRFDQILTTSTLSDGEGLDQLSGTYTAYGQDGNHFNASIADAPSIPEGQAMGDDLERASDHLPVYMDFQVPAIVSASASLVFGTVIVGATAEQNLSVSNVAATPADELDYTLTGTSDFAAPGGSFQANAGAGANLHIITMNTATAGVLADNVTVDSDDVDTPSTNVPASGTVLDHAVPSLASGTQTVLDTVDFGSFEEGMFSDQSTEAHNFGYNSLQALLNVYDAQIVGGAGRFSIVGGFSAGDVGGTPESYDLHFDDAGATTTSDTTYTATLTFSTRDQQGLDGATAASDLVVELEATVLASQTAVGDPVGVTATRLRANIPNPFTGSTRIQFDLAEPASARLTIYDVRGRLVRTLVNGWLGTGSYDLGWSGVNDTGRVSPPGIYFYVLETPGFSATRRMTKLR